MHRPERQGPSTALIVFLFACCAALVASVVMLVTDTSIPIESSEPRTTMTREEQSASEESVADEISAKNRRAAEEQLALPAPQKPQLLTTKQREAVEMNLEGGEATGMDYLLSHEDQELVVTSYLEVEKDNLGGKSTRSKGFGGNILLDEDYDVDWSKLPKGSLLRAEWFEVDGQAALVIEYHQRVNRSTPDASLLVAMYQLVYGGEPDKQPRSWRTTKGVCYTYTPK